jgi:hypothetical protein
MMASPSFCIVGVETEKFPARIFAVNQSIYTKTRVSNSFPKICRSWGFRDVENERDGMFIEWLRSAHPRRSRNQQAEDAEDRTNIKE